jgi:hypothetical protein
MLFCISIASITSAQNGSVYTRSGIGDLEYGYSAKMIGVGNLGITQLDPDHLTTSNPASWSALTRTRIEFGLGYRGILISDANQSNYTSEVEFTGFTFGFPASRSLGIGIVSGIVPYSSVSYNVKQNQAATPEIPALKNIYEGKGGLSKVFLGTSIYLPLNFSFGVSLDYFFGNQNYLFTREFENESDFINTVFENNHRSTGFGTSVGLISPNLAKDLKIDLFSDLRFGFAFNYLGKLDTDTIYTSTSDFTVDTVVSGSAKTEIPARLNAGLSFSFNDEYNISLDYMFQPFSKYKFDGVIDPNLKDANKFSAALEYQAKRTVGMTTWEQIIWRFGLSYEQTPYTFNGNDINQFSTFAGFSYPLGIENTIDFAVEYSNRGNTQNSLISENAIKVYLGISFGELWFLRYDK